MCWLPKSAAWLDDFMLEMLAFPPGAMMTRWTASRSSWAGSRDGGTDGWWLSVCGPDDNHPDGGYWIGFGIPAVERSPEVTPRENSACSPSINGISVPSVTATNGRGMRKRGPSRQINWASLLSARVRPRHQSPTMSVNSAAAPSIAAVSR